VPIVARLDGTTGAPDHTFSADGSLAPKVLYGLSALKAVAIEPGSGEIAAAGVADAQFLLMRFSATGAVDTDTALNFSSSADERAGAIANAAAAGSCSPAMHASGRRRRRAGRSGRSRG